MLGFEIFKRRTTQKQPVPAAVCESSNSHELSVQMRFESTPGSRPAASTAGAASPVFFVVRDHLNSRVIPCKEKKDKGEKKKTRVSATK